MALDILDEEGPTALSLRRLSTELKVGVMTLYSYVDSRDELDDAIVARVMPDPPETLDVSRPWDELLRDYMIGMYEAFQRHHGAAELFASRRVNTPAMDRVREYTLTIVRRSGLDDPEVVLAAGALGRYVIGCVLASGAQRAEASSDEVDRLRALPHDQFPVLRNFAILYPDHVSTEAAHFGIDLMIRGLGDLIERGSAGDAPPRPS